MSERTSGTSEATTQGVKVSVRSVHVPERSSPRHGRYFFVYHVSVENRTDEPVQLISRIWTITDGHGATQEVRGLGVVGQQPRISPGMRFEYTSACPLETPVGSMEGSYRMVQMDGSEFDARIETFTLAALDALN